MQLTSEIGPRPLGLTRIIVGSAALIRAIVAGQALTALTTPETLRAPYLDWLPDPTMPLVVVILAIWVASGVLFVLGWKVPITGSLLLLAIVTTLALDQQTYSNHLYLMSWLVLLLTVADAGAGVNIHRSDRPVIMWPVLLLQLQLSIVYGFSALTKFNESFLSGEVLAAALGRGLAPFPEALRTPRCLIPVAALTLFVELFIAFFIWRSRFRPAAFVLGFGLHLSITLLMADPLQLFVFSLEMLSLYPLFLLREPLRLVWNEGCEPSRACVRRLSRLDVLEALDPAADPSLMSPDPASGAEHLLHLTHSGETAHGFRAITLALEHLVPTIWVAPILRLPGVRSLGERWYRWQTRRGSCPTCSADLAAEVSGQ
jgi:hypothetical protein